MLMWKFMTAHRAPQLRRIPDNHKLRALADRPL